MSCTYFILLFVLVLVIGGFIIYSNRLPVSGRDEIYGPYEISGGAEDSLATIVDLISQYTDDFGETNVAQYLETYYNYSADSIESLHRQAERDGKKYLHLLIEQIMKKRDYSTAYEFIGKAHLTFAAFLSEDKREFLCEPRSTENISASTGGFSKLKTTLDKFLRKESIYLNDDTLDEELKNFLKITSKYRLITRIAKMDAKRIKKEIADNAGANYELDVLGLLPALRAFAKQYEEQYRTKQEFKQLKRSLDDMGVLSLADLAERLRNAHSHNLLRVVDHSHDEFERRTREAAQREAAQREAAQREAAQREAAQREATQREAAQREAAQRARQEAERRAVEAERQAEAAREQQLEVAFHNRLTPDMEVAMRAAGFTNRQEMFEHFKEEMQRYPHIGGWDEDTMKRIMREMTEKE
jgi:hypothetical protein